VAFNRQVDIQTAEALNETFSEVVVAPGYNADALEALQKKKQRRLMLLEGLETWAMVGGTVLPDRDLRKIVGGLLVQERDIARVTPATVNVVTKRAPTEDEMRALMFAWKVVKHVKSNAIIYANATETIGIGAGQMSRVDSSKIAVMKARKPLEGCVVASDAYFPFRDGVDAAIDAGATAIIQPGGSVRDEESVQACDERGVAMVFTGIRHFRHS
jgi:phosphoribosylaminoimidazolecarboxamide formyltransferase/IMP cyclohydrolase